MKRKATSLLAISSSNLLWQRYFFSMLCDSIQNCFIREHEKLLRFIGTQTGFLTGLVLCVKCEIPKWKIILV